VKLFSLMYDRALVYSKHPKAPLYLSILSFIESSFFPFPPPDVMLAPMALANREKAWYYAFLTTVMSVLGGLFGYLLGVFAFELIEPVIKSVGYWDKFETIKFWFTEWGIGVIFIAGFSPIPYKLITITSGVVGMALIPFIIASIIGRASRFYLVAGLIYLGGEKMERNLRKHIDTIGWGMVVLVVILYFVLRH